MTHTSVRIENFNLEEHLKKSDEINILVACKYNYDTRVGTCMVLLCYNGKCKYKEREVRGANSPNEVSIIGVGEVVRELPAKDKKITIVSGISLGFKNAAKGKGLYANKLQAIMEYAESCGNELSSIAILDGMETIKQHIFANMNNTTGVRLFVEKKAHAVSKEAHVAPTKVARGQEFSLPKIDAVPKHLVVVTGISGSGKTTLAKEIQERVGGVLLSVDDFKQKEYEYSGFVDLDERYVLNDLAKCVFKREVMLCMRDGEETVIVEYPFSLEWGHFFASECAKYGYTLVVVNCNTAPFDEIWERRCVRDIDRNLRPMCLTAERYINGKEYMMDNKLSEEHRKEQLERYKIGYYTSIVGDLNYTDEEAYGILREGKEWLK